MINAAMILNTQGAIVAIDNWMLIGEKLFASYYLLLPSD
jgi:hypothetical protein